MKLTPEQLEEMREWDSMGAQHPQWGSRCLTDRRALLGHIGALEAELAEQTRLVDIWQGKWRHCEDKFQATQSYGVLAEAKHLARISALEVTLRKADEIEHSIGAEDWYKERDALLATAETVCDETAGSIPAHVLTEHGDAPGRGTGVLTATPSVTSDAPTERLCKPLCAHGKHAWERCQACEMDGGTGFTHDRAGVK